MLYVWDPVALHAMLIKEPYVYEEAEWFIKYVPVCPSDLIVAFHG